MGLTMAALFSADRKGSLASIRYNMLCKKVARATMFVNLNDSHQPPPPVNFIPPMRTYFQVMEWMGCSEEMQPSEWRWKAE